MNEHPEQSPTPESLAEPQPGPNPQGLLKASGITSSMTMVSRVLGLVRDIVIARVFGTSDGADAFFLANKIPNFMRRLFAEGAFNQAFVPILSEYRTQRSHADVRHLINAVSGSLGGFLLLLTVAVILLAPWLAIPIAFGWYSFDAEKFALFVEMLRITFPYLLLVSMTALCGAILNSYEKFAVPAITPALLNLSLISCSFLLVPYMRQPELALAWAVLIAGVAQLLFQLPFLARMKLLPKPGASRDAEAVARIRRLMLPALFGVSVSQINLLLDTLIASFLVTGSVGWLYYSDRLMELPLGTFGIAIAIVVLPNLSRKHADASLDEFRDTLDWAFRLVCLIAIPATLGLVLIAEPLLSTLFLNENFPREHIGNTVTSLRAYALGLIAFMAIKIFAPGFYARQNTSTPVRIGIIAMATNMALNILFFLNGLAHTGLALATSLAAFVNATLLWFHLHRDGVYRFQPGWLRLLFQIILANGLMTLFLLQFAGPPDLWYTLSVWPKVLRLAALVLGAIAVYGISLLLAGLRWRHISR